MKRSQLILLIVSCFIGVAAVATSDLTRIEFANFDFVRVVLGLLLVFVAPGFALVSAVISKSQFSYGECALASLGTSLAISTISAVALAASPAGVTRLSLSIVLGCCTVVLSLVAVVRSLIHNYPRWTNEDAPN
jgi:uncharacterized membrane protein